MNAPDDRMENVATYSEARSEYTKQLATFIVPTIVQWFQQLWARNAAAGRQAMVVFQNELEEIPRWNQDRIHDEVRVLIERTGCDYMEELVTAVFVAHTKVLTAVRLSTKQKKLSITVPKLDHFVHRVFRESARAYWKSPFLFMDNGAVVERQKNVLQIEALASEAITSAVRSLLPVKQILQDYLGDDTEEVEDDDAEEAVPEVVQAAPVEAEAEEEVEEVVPAPSPSPTPTPAAPATPTVPEPAAVVTATPAAAAPVPTLVVQDVSAAPAIVKIDTETSVHFHDYDAVFDETAGAPEMRYAPKEGDDEDEEFDDGLLHIDEESAAALSDDDAEDLEAPPLPKKAPVPAFSEAIDDAELVVLD
jgi:hypothetical protein